MTEHEAVAAAVRDYFESWFDGDAERMDRALHPDLVKRRASDELGITTKERMLELTSEGAGREDGVDRRLDIVVDEVYGDIATARVDSAVYREYVHLVRTGGVWKVANALWRST